MKKIIINILPFKLLAFLNIFFVKKRNVNFIQNINWNPNDPYQKKVLFSYVFSHLFKNKKGNQAGTRETECSLMIHEFINKGYCLDLVDCRDEVNELNILNTKYDIVFGFGKAFNYLNNNNLDGHKSVMYLTEKHPSFSLKKENERIEYFKQRHNKKVGLSRSNLYYKENDFNNLDAIVYIGNSFEANLIPVNVPKFAIQPTGLLNSNYQQNKRNITESKKRFLWFGSLGAIHKGLDLLIDVFREQTDCTLYIGGLGQLDKKQLPNFEKSRNIVDLGFVNVQSDEFIKIINQCSFVVLPSCSEALSTGVITCMNHGLIPVVSKETGFQISNFGLELEGFKIETISKAINIVSNYSDKRVLEQHKIVYDYSIENFSLLKFQNTFSSILNKL
jgi:hypothetical protein